MTPVPGHDGDFVRECTAGEWIELWEGGETSGILSWFRLAQLCTVDAEGARRWATLDDALAAPRSHVMACATVAQKVHNLNDQTEGDAGN